MPFEVSSCNLKAVARKLFFMDIEELTTSQIILLVLLVSFVTSIATGIVTVTLLAQAPPAVTQTVNRIVERTVETVVPKDSGTTQVVTKETTVVVKEDDLITDSVAKSLGKTGRVFSGTSTSSPVSALATQIISGVLVTDANFVDKEHLVQIGNTTDIFTVSKRFPEIGIAVLVPKATSTSLTNAFRVGDTGSVKLGQTVIALVSVANERVSIGSVAARFAFADTKAEGKDPLPVKAIDTNINAALVPGTPLVNVYGDLLGISTATSKAVGGLGAFISASDIVDLLSAPRATSTPAN